MHFEFKNDKVWELFNQRVAKIKGYVLFEAKEQTEYQKRQTGRSSTPGKTPQQIEAYRDWETDRKSTRLNSSHRSLSRMPSSA